MFRLWGSGFRLWGVGFWVWGLGFSVGTSGRISDLEIILCWARPGEVLNRNHTRKNINGNSTTVTVAANKSNSSISNNDIVDPIVLCTVFRKLRGPAEPGYVLLA